MHKRTTTIRYFLRTQPATISFFPWGLLGLLLILLTLLYGIFSFAKNTIESNVKSHVTSALTDNNLSWVDVSVDGQDVHLTGEGTAAKGEKAVALAENVQGATWLGSFTSPRKVTSDFTEPKPVVAKPAPAKPKVKKLSEAPKVVPAQQPIKPKSPPVWGDVTATLKNNILTVKGLVANEQQKRLLLQRAQASKGANVTRIINQLGIVPHGTIKGSLELATRAATALSRCSEGTASAAKGVFSMQCQAPRKQVDTILAFAKRPLEAGRFGSVSVSASQDCNREFAQVLNGKTIQFAISSAELKSSSATLLDSIAEIAKECPGRIAVEGHTDDTGLAENNQILSQARAESVVIALQQRGVEQNRLTPRGYGSERPKVEGTTVQARAINRRIEFRVLGIGEN